MTVKSLNYLDKAYIITAFTAKTKTINELAEIYGRHRTTIVRVIEEQGIDPGIRRRKAKKKLNISGTTTGRIEMFKPPKQPWYTRLLNRLSVSILGDAQIR
jgi:transposase